MSPRRLTLRLLPLALVVAVGCGGGSEPAPERRSPASDAEVRALVRTAPPKLADIYAQGDRLLPGGEEAFRARLEKLRGYPVVVNKWASWCGPCKAELPFFRRQALERGRGVAFLGANTNDSEGAAQRFLNEVPVPFPSYFDPNGDVAQVFRGTIAFPTTAFYDRQGRLATVKQGAYASERELAADIDRYTR